jgi:hypothetical protein
MAARDQKLLAIRSIRPGRNPGSLTLKSSLTFFSAATPENQPLWIHRGKVFCCLEAQSDIGSNDNDGLACKVDVFHRGCLPPLVLDVLEKTDSSHDIGHNRHNALVLASLFR